MTGDVQNHKGTKGTKDRNINIFVPLCLCGCDSLEVCLAAVACGMRARSSNLTAGRLIGLHFASGAWASRTPGG
jgi:hypothetical protein